MMTVVAGLLDATTLLSWAGSTSTHMSGKFLSVGVYISAADVKALMYFGMVVCFFIGAFFAGWLTRTPKHKTLWTCAAGMAIVGVGCCLTSVLFIVAGKELSVPGRRLAPAASSGGPAALPWWKTPCAAPYMAAMTSGFQNAMLTTITGFMRTTHMTGTVTDVGLLVGQAYPTKMQDAAHWWKTRILAGLIGTWSLSGLLGQLLYVRAGMGDYLGFVAGGLAFVVSAIGFWRLTSEQKKMRKVAAEEAALAAKKKAEAETSAKLTKQKTRLAAVTKVVGMRLQMGMEALQEIAKEMDGNLESMPSPAAKVVFKAMNVNKMVGNLKGLSSKRLVGEGSVAEREAVLASLAAVCDWLLEQPDLVVRMEKEKGAAGANADFLAAFSAQEKAFKRTEEDEAATKVQAAMRGKQARSDLSKQASQKSA